MKPLTLLVCLLVSLCLAPLSQAQWALAGRDSLDAPDGVDFAQVEITGADGRKVELHIVAFHNKSFTLDVIDDVDGDATLGSAAASRGALAAVNGGYFHPDRRPLGLVISNGKTLHGMERARLLSGVLAISAKDISLRRVGEMKGTAGLREALQAGPFLIDGGKPVTGLNATRSAARTIVCTLSSGRTALIVCRSATLAETARILLTPGVLPGGGKIHRALNLDGGSSTGMWVHGKPEPFYLREFKDVRNFVAVVERK